MRDCRGRLWREVVWEGERYRSMERVDVDCRVRRRREKVVTGGKDAEEE
jgi:hypothetical protein